MPAPNLLPEELVNSLPFILLLSMLISVAVHCPHCQAQLPTQKAPVPCPLPTTAPTTAKAQPHFWAAQTQGFHQALPNLRHWCSIPEVPHWPGAAWIHWLPTLLHWPCWQPS